MEEEKVLKDQRNYIINYLRASEKSKQDFKIGAEFEHIIIDRHSLTTVGYNGEKGVESTLKDLLNVGWVGEYEGDYLMGLHKDGSTITLEPGAQVEVSFQPYRSIVDMERCYLSFLKDIIPILDRKKQYLMAIGYQPVSRIEDIDFIPKKRYEYMAEYLGARGKHAHNMMKGTASIQVAVDFSSEEDYIKKFRVTNALAPIISAIFDNSPFFEGEAWPKQGLRTHIWNHCDRDRCGLVENVLDKQFGYGDYADYMLMGRPILLKEKGEFIYTKNEMFKDVFQPNRWSKEDFEHVCTMFFPDVRTKNFIEIRMADSVPYPLNFSGVALWKGLLYNEENLEKLYRMTMNLSNEDIRVNKEAVIQEGLRAQYMKKTIAVWGLKLIELAKQGLPAEEKSYLAPLETLLCDGTTLAQTIKERGLRGQYEALEICNLNRLV